MNSILAFLFANTSLGTLLYFTTKTLAVFESEISALLVQLWFPLPSLN